MRIARAACLLACALQVACSEPSPTPPPAPANDAASPANEMNPTQAAPAPNAELLNTYWKLVRLGDTPIVIEDDQREPYFVLYSEDQRVGGYGGCNRLTGQYVLSEDTLTFSQVGATMMACTDGMEHERAFFDALGQGARWRIQGETLELLDANGQQVALFESRYLR